MSTDGPTTVCFTTLGIVAIKSFHQRATLRRAAEEVMRADNRYRSIRVEPGDRRGAHVLVVRQRAKAGVT